MVKDIAEEQNVFPISFHLLITTYYDEKDENYLDSIEEIFWFIKRLLRINDIKTIDIEFT